MILIIKTNKEKLHDLEFVKPIEDILNREKIVFFTKYYLEIGVEELKKADKIILCGTSLMDNSFLNDIDKFNWIKDFEKPILGICAGMQIVGKIFGGKIKSGEEIGYYHEGFDKNFLGLNEETKVYHLHNNYVELGKEFEVYSSSKIIQAVKHKKKEIYLALFHPEVRNKEVIINFLKK